MKQRHGCLTAWLVLMMIANSGVAVLYFFFNSAILKNFPDTPAWMFTFLGVMGVLNLVCAAAIFQWKKWGFFGFVGTSITAFIVNISLGLNLPQALFGLLGLVILYLLLQMGNENKGWNQLE